MKIINIHSRFEGTGNHQFYYRIIILSLSVLFYMSASVSAQKVDVLLGMNNMDPFFITFPDNIVIENSMDNTVEWKEPVMYNENSYKLKASHQSGDAFPVGVTEVIYTVKSKSGAEYKKSFYVTVLDGKESSRYDVHTAMAFRNLNGNKYQNASR